MTKQTTVDAKALEAERLATCLRAVAVDARETEDWQDAEADLVAAADFLASLSEQPAPDHAGLADKIGESVCALVRDWLTGPKPLEGNGLEHVVKLRIHRLLSEAIAALSRAPEAVEIARGEDDMPERIWAGDFDAQGFGHCVSGPQGGLYAEYVLATPAASLGGADQ